MSNIEILRDHSGALHLHVDGRYAVGSQVAAVQNINDLGLCAVVWVPLKLATLGEVRNVVPMVRPAGK